MKNNVPGQSHSQDKVKTHGSGSQTGSAEGLHIGRRQFLTTAAKGMGAAALLSSGLPSGWIGGAYADEGPETSNIKFGMIALTDCSPIVIAHEKGFFRKYGINSRLLDEPFGMLDSLTRFELQKVLLDLWGRDQKTAFMVTHDVDEAIYLADRIVMMTNGPEAEVGDMLNVHFSRPRDRKHIMDHPDYYRLREYLITFLEERAEKKVISWDTARPAQVCALGTADQKAEASL